MAQHPVELTDVIYNPASNAFEALARVHDPAGSHSYACRWRGPITAEFEEAAEALALQAGKRHARRTRQLAGPKAHIRPAAETTFFPCSVQRAA